MNLQMLKKAMIDYVDFKKAVWSLLKYPLSIMGGRKAYLEDYRIYGNTVQEGKPSPEAPAVIESVGELVTEGENKGKYKIPVLARGKNLYNKELYPMEFVYWINPEGSISQGTNYVSTGYVPCENLQKQTVTLSPTSGYNTSICFYNADKIFIKGTAYKEKPTCTVKVPENAFYMRFCTLAEYKKVFQIELGDSATEYEDYIEPKTVDIYLDEPLRKINECMDYIDFKRNVVVRKNTKRIYDGAEGWKTVSSQPGHFYLEVSNVASSIPNTSKKILCLSNFFEEFKWDNLYQNISLSNGKYLVGIARSNNGIRLTPSEYMPTVSEWKAQLKEWKEKGTPLIVWYVDNEKEESITLPRLPQFKGTTIYEIQIKVKPSAMEAYYYGEA